VREDLVRFGARWEEYRVNAHFNSRLMKSSTLFAIGLAASFLVSAQPKVKAATEGTTKFDGSWSVTVDFHEYKTLMAARLALGSNISARR
jgi:hypothetical protein